MSSTDDKSDPGPDGQRSSEVQTITHYSLNEAKGGNRMIDDDKQQSLDHVEIDPARYRTLSEPFDSKETGQAAILAFFKDLGEIRVKHKIPDLYVVIRASVLTETKEEGIFTTSLHYGSELEAEGMLAWALGRVQCERQDRIAKQIKGAMKHAKHRK